MKIFQPQMDRMDADERDGLHVNETKRIIGCAFSVLNALGHGFHEKPYEQALTVEFLFQEIPFTQQTAYPIHLRLSCSSVV